MPKKNLLDITYKCQCGNVQTITYFADDTPLPATCCVKCRAGFNTDLSYGAMAARGMGMLPTGKPVYV